jgi:hypothetical protein
MPRPEAILEGFLQLIDNIDKGKATAWQEYYRNYDYYLGRQQALFGPDWHTPTDVIAEARHYKMFADNTIGEHTELLAKFASKYVTQPIPKKVLKREEVVR